MLLFDTKVQLLKYKVLKAVAKHAFEDKLDTCYYDIPMEIVPGREATMRCCVYKERAILAERIKLACGGDPLNPNVIEVLDIACDECPVSSYIVSESCRGCIAHRCESVCPVGALTFHDHRAHINNEKCIECGKCASVCPYSSIYSRKRPCELSCKVKAITMDENKRAKINNDKCIACGACVYQCPFGAISDKSYILNAVHLLKEQRDNPSVHLYAVVAPSISTQFNYAEQGQVTTALKKLGFYQVVEAALGADMVAYKEAEELVEKGFLTSSCCPAFVDYVEKNFPQLADKVSKNLSPMAEVSRYIKEHDAAAKIIFIGPCTAKKMEQKKDAVRNYVDCVLTFEELQALFDSQDIDVAAMEPDPLQDASYYGRIFARSGGVADAVAQALKEHNISPEEFTLKALPCNGIEACRTALLRASKNVLQENFIEGMACVGGCIGGAGCLTHEPRDKNEIDNYGKAAGKASITEAIDGLSSLTASPSEASQQ